MVSDSRTPKNLLSTQGGASLYCAALSLIDHLGSNIPVTRRNYLHLQGISLMVRGSTSFTSGAEVSYGAGERGRGEQLSFQTATAGS